MIPPVLLQQQQHRHRHRRRHSYQAIPLDLFSPPTIQIEAPTPAARPKSGSTKRRTLSAAAMHGWLKDVEPLTPSARSPPTPVGSPAKPSYAPSTSASLYDADCDDSEWAYPLSATPHDARLRSVEDLAERARKLDAVRDELQRQHARLALEGGMPHQRNRCAGGDDLRKETLSKGLWAGLKNKLTSSKALANLATLADPSRRGSQLDISDPIRRESKLFDNKLGRPAAGDPAQLTSGMHSRDASSKRATAEPEMLKRWLQPSAAESMLAARPPFSAKMARGQRTPDGGAAGRAAERLGSLPAPRPATSYDLAGWTDTPTATANAMRRSSGGPLLLDSHALWATKYQSRTGSIIERGSDREASVYLKGLDRPTLEQIQRAATLFDEKDQPASMYVPRTSKPPAQTPPSPHRPSKHTKNGSAFSIPSLFRVGSRRKGEQNKERVERTAVNTTPAGASPSTTTNGSTRVAPAPYAGLGKGRPVGVHARLPSADYPVKKTLRSTMTRSASGPPLSAACCHCGGHAPPIAAQHGTATPSAAGPPQSVADPYMEWLFAAIERRLSETKSDSSGDTVTEGNQLRFSRHAEDVRSAVAPVIMDFFPPATALAPVGAQLPPLAASNLDVPTSSSAAAAHGRYSAEMEMMTRSARFVHEKRARNRLEKEWMQQTFYA